MYFTFGNMQGKCHKRNSWIEVSDKTIPKPKIRKWIKWYTKHSYSFVSSFIPKRGLDVEWVIFLFLAIVVTDTAFVF